MESIKHKMDTMVKEKDAAVEKAVGFESETVSLEKSATKFEKEVDEIQRKIAKVEDQLDICMSSTKETADRLEIADKEAIDTELQGGALKRRVALLEEEAARNKAKLQVSTLFTGQARDYELRKILKNALSPKHPLRKMKKDVELAKLVHLLLNRLECASNTLPNKLRHLNQWRVNLKKRTRLLLPQITNSKM